ncbi:MAG: hypothetical protein WCJ09_17110 [Planctomycetota bacterium]
MRADRWQTTIFLFAAIACSLSGCGRASNAPKLHAVSGILTVSGQPAPNIIVHFVPAKGRPSTGVTDAKGAFELKYEKDVLGVVPGDHKVWIEYRPGTPAEEMAMREGKSSLAKEVLEALQKFATPETSSMTVKIDGPKKDLKVEL